MRLLNTQTLEFEIFYDESTPQYLILSHTWGNEEVTYQDMRYLQRLKSLPETLRNDPVALFSLNAATGSTRDSETAIAELSGYRKILGTANIAKKEGFDYFWIDTCCIDKSFSTELQEAINSMYQWYQKAALCVVLLEDVDYDEIVSDGGNFKELLQRTRWVKRGWTLQELIASRSLSFFDKEWRFIDAKVGRLSQIREVTGIPESVLDSGDLSRSSVAQKMSWAAHRSTTRIEDRAYSLLGIFDVHIPMLYGEGSNAFIRLQEEILRIHPDDSIFTWIDPDATLSTCCGLLARSPDSFAACGNVRSDQPAYVNTTNLGIRLDIEMNPLACGPDVFEGRWKNEQLFVGKLRSGPLGGCCTIVLRKLEDDRYGAHCVRVKDRCGLPILDYLRKKKTETIYVRQNPKLPSRFFSNYMHCFQLRRGPRSDLRAKLNITDVWPQEHWRSDTRQLLIPQNEPSFLGIIRFVIDASTILTPYRAHCRLILGYNKSESNPWCKLIRDDYVPKGYVYDERSWREALGFSQCMSITVLANLFPSIETNTEIGASIEAGIFDDKMALFVSIDGLTAESTTTVPSVSASHGSAFLS